MRTPPKHQNTPFLPPSGEEVTPIPPRYGNQQSDTPLPSSKPSELNRVQVLHVHSKASERDPQQPPPDDKEMINVAGRMPPQQPDLVLGQIHDRQGREDDVYRQASQQQPRKALGRGLIDEFMPPNRPVRTCTCIWCIGFMPEMIKLWHDEGEINVGCICRYASTSLNITTLNITYTMILLSCCLEWAQKSWWRWVARREQSCCQRNCNKWVENSCVD